MAKHAHRIRTEKDIPPTLDARLANAYLRTTYRVFAATALDIRVGRRHPELDLILGEFPAETWAFLTAFNPRSQLLPEAENLRRLRLLENALRAAGDTYIYNGVGIGDAAGWEAERSFFVAGISRTAAARLAKQFEQNAIVFGEIGGLAELLWLG